MGLSHSSEQVMGSTAYGESLVQTETISLKKSNYDCFEDNSLVFKDCINEFIAEEIGCYLPWAKSNPNFEECKTDNELILFRNLSMYMSTIQIEEKITKKGCFKPNCKRTTWIRNIGSNWNHDGFTDIFLNIPSTAIVIQRTEVLLANFSTFIADCGSYMGLFLGASVLSLTDILMSYIIRMFRNIWNKIQPHENQF